MGNIVGQRGSSPDAKKRGARSREAALGTIGGRVSTGSVGGTKAPAPNRTRTPKPTGKRKPAQKEKTPEELAAARLRQYKLQELAGDILPGEKGLNACMRCRVAIADRVQLVYIEGANGQEGSADYTHLQTCGSIWLCAPCAAKEAERRRRILARVNGNYLKADGSIWFTTCTVSHHEYDSLEDLLENFLAARKKMKEGRQGMSLRNDFNIEGTISVLEITWSKENGHHPHVHELVYCRDKNFDVNGYEAVARTAWKRAAAAYGMSMNEHGFEVQRTYGAVQDYVTKYGHAPASDRVWGTESEMVKGHLKRGRMSQHYTPFAMLDEILEVQSAMKKLREKFRDVSDEAQRTELDEYLQELQAWQLRLRSAFREYAHCFKGKKQLTPSKGMQPWWKQAEAEIEQEDAAEAEQGQVEQNRHVLVEFYDDQWNEVVWRRLRGEVREEARMGCPGRVLSFLETSGIETYPEQYTRFEGWRVMTPDGMGTISLVTRCSILNRWRCSVTLDVAGSDGAKWRAFDLLAVTVMGEPHPEQEAAQAA